MLRFLALFRLTLISLSEELTQAVDNISLIHSTVRETSFSQNDKELKHPKKLNVEFTVEDKCANATFQTGNLEETTVIKLDVE